MPRVAFNFLLLNPCYLYLLSNLAIRCVNDCLRVSEEKEVLSDGAGAGSRFVARGWADWIWRESMQIFVDAMTRPSRPNDHIYMTIDHPYTGWFFYCVRLHSKSHQKSSKFRISLWSGTVTPSPDTTPIHSVTPFIYPVTPCYNPCHTPFTSLVFKIMSWIMTYDKRLGHGSIKWVRHAVCTRYSLIGFHAGVRGN